jgi:ABC-type transporter Mla subunit MlaD
MLGDHAMKAADKASSVFGGLASTNRTESLNTLTAEQKNFDDQVKAFLGDARYAQYQDYQQTVGERMLLNQFKQQVGSDFNLSDPQTEALLSFMKEEKKNVAASTGLPLADANQDTAKLQAMMSDGKLDELLQAQETIGQRVYDRARTILSPEQLATLGRFQTNQMQMMRLGMGMAKKMFAPDKPAAGAAPPGQ